MFNLPRRFLILCLFVSASAFAADAELLNEPEDELKDESKDELRVAIIGGLKMSGAWYWIEAAAEEALNMEITTVIAEAKETVVPAYMRGEVDFLLMHGGDETIALEALGYATALRTWGYNDFVFVGPRADPAGIAKATSGIEVMRLLHTSQQPLISFRDIGSHQILRRLMDAAGLVPSQLNILVDAVERPQQILTQAVRDQAYVIVGHMPVAIGRMAAEGAEILFSGDPAMRRAYVVVTPGPKHTADAKARVNAERLAGYLLSAAGQQLLEETGPRGELPWIYPRSTAGGLLQFQDPARNRNGNRSR